MANLNVTDIVNSIVALHTVTTTTTDTRPPVYKAIGISLAVSSGLFIGVSFVLKKMGLLKANVKYNEEAGEGYGYLKNAWWWSGMTLMIIGEICNFVAYAFVDAILVTPLGALSVVVTTILSAIFLKERLSFVGKIGCFNCILGSIVIVVNAPEQSSAGTIQDMQHFVIAPGFLSYAGVVIVGCAIVAFWAGPRYGKRSMLVYLTVCSLIGGLSVVATQGLGAAVVTQASGTPQFNQWFLYVLLVFVVTTLVTEIIFLNKALNLFNAALVTPTYYVYFTSATIVTSAILFQGFKGTVTSIATVVMGCLQSCSGVILLQLSQSAKDVPDAAVFTGDLDQVRTVAEQEQPESEPKADAIRGTAGIIRQLSQSRQKRETAEARRIQEDHLKDLEPIREDEHFEWDGLRRRRTTVGSRSTGSSVRRRKTLHPPLGMTHFPGEGEDSDDAPLDDEDAGGERNHEGMLGSFRRRARNAWVHKPDPNSDDPRSPMHPVALTEVNNAPTHPRFQQDTSYHHDRTDTLHPPGTPIRWADDVGGDLARPLGSPSSGLTVPPTPPPHSAKRQFSFQNVFHRTHNPNPNSSARDAAGSSATSPGPSSSSFHHTHSHGHGHEGGKLDVLRAGLGSRQSTTSSSMTKGATEEERLGLVKGDSHVADMSRLPEDDDPTSSSDDDDDDWQIESKPRVLSGSSESNSESDRERERERAAIASARARPSQTRTEEEMEREREAYVESRRRWRQDGAGAGAGGQFSSSTPPPSYSGPGPGPGPSSSRPAGRRRGPRRGGFDDDDDDDEDDDDPVVVAGGSASGVGGMPPASGHAFL